MVYIFVFIFGAIIGSFLNVVALRHNTGEPIIYSHSRCFSCGKKLFWKELIPIFSFIFQKGKCRHCRSNISFQYPFIELLTGLIFLLIFLKFQFTDYGLLIAGYWFIIFSLLIIIAIYDFRHQIIPNKFVYAFIILSLISCFVLHILCLYNFLAGLIFFGFFALLWLVSRGKCMGFGDAKLALGIGWMLGLKSGIFALLFSFWIGALVGILLVLFRKKKYNLKSAVPFGPFLALGSLIAFFI